MNNSEEAPQVAMRGKSFDAPIDQRLATSITSFTASTCTSPRSA